eukprot:8670067-Pyramimonas_sp.AAC.1
MLSGPSAWGANAREGDKRGREFGGGATNERALAEFLREAQWKARPAEITSQQLGPRRCQ